MTQSLSVVVLSAGLDDFNQLRGALTADSRVQLLAGGTDIEQIHDEVVRLKTDTPPLQAPSVGAVRAIGPFARLTKDALKETAFTDTQDDLEKPAKVEGDSLVVP